MDVFANLDDVSRDPGNVITVGSFDGLHRGHRFLLAELQRSAAARSGTSALITFEPHPRLVLGKRSPDDRFRILTTVAEKRDLLQQFGMQKFIVIPFTHEFAQLSAEAYVKEILWQRIGLQAIVVGDDHAFGRDRTGSIATLRQYGRELGFDVIQVSKLNFASDALSSTRIRQLLSDGDVDRANSLLGYIYGMDARVVPGENRGKALGFPTANLARLEADKLVPGHGVYAVTIKVENVELQGMANIGVRPTFDGGDETVEVHIFDFNRDIYGQSVRLHFYHRLRDEQRFSDVTHLVDQLHRDKAESLRYFVHMHDNHLHIYSDGEEHATHERHQSRRDQKVR